MRTLIAGVAVASAAALAFATPAQAAPKDPVAAVKKQLVAGKGVSFTDTTTLVREDGSEPFMKRKGKLMFGKGRIAAADMATTYDAKKPDELFKDDRTIVVGKTAYVSGDMYEKDLPGDTTWRRSKHAALSSWFAQPINPVEPATLKKLLARAERTSNGYRGTITFDQLKKVSPWFRTSIPVFMEGGTKVSWRLTVSRSGVPQRLTSSYSGEGLVGAWQDITVKQDTTFRGWGAKVSIKAPPAGEVAS
ncbi:hypothetical protein [Nonomuraea sp. SBT364]|uniref:hypothetical protein n=1 Tax=Nonomuraea sp. SBT364 TaxID=1580530 RepID=UPI00066ADF6E|nr:hypothetical protein [Nonomuraea sp. SBT364]